MLNLKSQDVEELDSLSSPMLRETHSPDGIDESTMFLVAANEASKLDETEIRTALLAEKIAQRSKQLKTNRSGSDLSASQTVDRSRERPFSAKENDDSKFGSSDANGS